jgi:hypothetical protein
MKNKIYTKKCEVCGREFHSLSESQLDWMLLAHKNKHKTKVEASKPSEAENPNDQNNGDRK